MAPPV
jgi:serine/threonine protein kinase